MQGGLGGREAASVPTTSPPAGDVTLSCLNCADQRVLKLDGAQLSELLTKQQIRLFCANCQSLTSWCGVEPDRRTGQQRRAGRHISMEVSLRVRSDASELRFTEVTHTRNGSPEGACFTLQRPLRQGMVVHITMPYEEGMMELPERRARVVRMEKKGDAWEVAVQFLS